MADITHPGKLPPPAARHAKALPLRHEACALARYAAIPPDKSNRFGIGFGIAIAIGVDIETDCDTDTDSDPDLLNLQGKLVKTCTANILQRALHEPFIIPPALRVIRRRK